MNAVRERAVKKVRELVLKALAGHRARVWLFGSCARGDIWQSSDIDVAIEAAESLPDNLIPRLRLDLEESTIPYDVDIVDLAKSDRDFRDRVRREGIEWSS